MNRLTITQTVKCPNISSDDDRDAVNVSECQWCEYYEGTSTSDMEGTDVLCSYEDAQPPRESG